MDRPKILFVTKDFSQYLERNFHYLQLELAKHANVVLDTRGGNISEIMRRHSFTPDFILFNDIFHSTHCPPVEGMFDLQIPWGMIMHDLHGKEQERREFLAKGPGRIFTIYRSAFRRRFPEYKGELHWLPHFAEPSIFRNYFRPKSIDLLLMGAINRKVYPLRHLMRNTYKNRPGFVHHRHPGYMNFEPEEKVFVAKQFAVEVNRSKLFLTCDSIHRYPLRKYFEVPASYSLLVGTSNEDLEALGFVPDQHFLKVDEDNFHDKIEFYLRPRNASERDRLTRQGYQFIHKHHTTRVRAKELLDIIRKIIKQS